ncbi:MAG: sulfate adenylyltransferase [Acidobacteria bacterium RBG_16_68_9]|nr:MAG: sulfate adenylyltransferase [Acidobacteria bacterium RBG_16_68_9]
MPDLVPVHGGLDAPVSRVVPLSRRKRFLAEAAELPRVELTRADLSTVYRIADGTLSPLTGAMDEETWHYVLDHDAIDFGFRHYAWTAPISFPVDDEESRHLRIGRSAALVHQGEIVAILRASSVFEWDKAKQVEKFYGTKRTDHPGARMIMDDPRTRLVGGELWALPQPLDPDYGQCMLSPRQLRTLITERRWDRALAFQTRNPLHRAHEYALVAGVERLTREGHFAGAVLNPLVGELKGDDVPARVRMQCYRTLHDCRLLGLGDKDEALWRNCGYDLSDVFELVGLDIKMLYGGPKEAVMHGIYRQNLGFTDIVIGRKHADAPYDDGQPIWGDFDAQEIFTHLGGDLRIRPCNIGFAAYYESAGRVDLMELHPNEKPMVISGSAIRKMLTNGEHPDGRILRPEIADILIAYYRDKAGTT